MIDRANQAAEALTDSELADELGRHRFTAASMRRDARRLTSLHTRVQSAKGRLTSALAALRGARRTFGKRWSTYCNFVRGLTANEALRNEHGVSTPGRRKTSSLQRRPRLAKTHADTHATNDVQSPSSGKDDGTGTDGRE
jgi:hypothetical protein